MTSLVLCGGVCVFRLSSSMFGSIGSKSFTDDTMKARAASLLCSRLVVHARSGNLRGPAPQLECEGEAALDESKSRIVPHHPSTAPARHIARFISLGTKRMGELCF